MAKTSTASYGYTHTGRFNINMSNQEESECAALATIPCSGVIVSNANANRKKKHRRTPFKETSQTKTAAILSCVTIALLAIVALTTHSFHYLSPSSSSSTRTRTRTRILEDNGDMNDGEYAGYTCDDIFEYTEPNSDERCSYAQTCNSNRGLFLSFIFCNTWNLNLSIWVAILSPFLCIYLILLFRMLGSTAEDFFSPSLEMFSMKMGLPPRFAGVTLLALGNGAADVSATVSAIALNPQEGYQMSLGALTGAGMFVGTVVAGIVIVIADGVKCRGALVRDLLMFIFTLGVVWGFFEQGNIGPLAISTFFWLYFSFVVVVLVADIYHRAVVLPRIRKEEALASNATAGASTSLSSSGEIGTIVEGQNEDGNVALTTEVELASSRTSSGMYHTPLNSEMMEDTFDDEPTSPLRPSSGGIGGGIHENFSLHGEQGQVSKKSKFRRGLDRVMIAMSNYGPEEGKSPVNQDSSSSDGGQNGGIGGGGRSHNGWGSSLDVTNQERDRHVKLHGTTGILRTKSRSDDEVVEEEESTRPREYGPAASYRALMEGVDNMCTAEGSTVSGMATTWDVAAVTARDEFREHFEDYVNDIWENDENNVFDKFFMMVELPFTTMRKLSIPIPCDDYYCRGLVAMSLALSPIWFGMYMILERHTNLFMFGGFPYIEIATLTGAIIGFFFAKFAPPDEKDLSLKVSVPIAFFGFIIAATWIDAIADLLVKLLTLLGVICRIPGSIMGLTILAWGNSMGDLSANMTMAKKGLANMAITACFAGPVFNILVGLGGGFAKLNAQTGQEFTEVELSPSINVGFCFLVANCILVMVAGLIVNRGRIPKGYGYVALALYVLYVLASVGLQYYYPDDEDDDE